MSERGAKPPVEAAKADNAVGSSPTHISNPKLRYEAEKALAWSLVVGFVILAAFLAQSLLVIFGAMVFAAMLDGGARLLGRAVKIGRGWRLAMVLVAMVAFVAWLAYFAGSQISQQAAEFPALVGQQLGRFFQWLQDKGLDVGQTDVKSLVGNVFSGVGTVTKAIGGLLGGITTGVLIMIIGIYLAIDPRPYERGLAWMVPEESREAVAETLDVMAFTLRRLLGGRLLGMFAEGLFTWALLSLIGVPMAALLGLITGLLAFIPNIGAIISGVLMTLVGFSGGTEMGLWTIATYFLVQNFDGYILVPMIAKKTVDLAPALVLMSQLIFGVLFGILGLALADPMLAMIKVALEKRSERFDRDNKARKASAE